ncbi:MAG: RNA polymerase sigma factor [Phycisphaerales bacterium]
MLHQTATHATLLARVADGTDPAAWREFCDRYGELIRAFCRRQGVQPADAEDVHQDVLLSLTKSMPGFRYDPQKGKFRSYLKTIVLHAIYRRSFQKGGGRSLGEVEEASRAAATDAGVDEQWETEWRQHHLRQALRTIGPEFNEADMLAFQRYALEGRDAQEVGAALGLSLDQVYQAKSRIVRRLTRVIETQVAEEG